VIRSVQVNPLGINISLSFVGPIKRTTQEERMYKAYQRKLPHHLRILEPWSKDSKKIVTQLALARPSQYILGLDFSLNNCIN